MIIVPTEKSFDRQRMPVMLCLVVLLNILIFFFYQSADDEKFSKAIFLYEQAQLLSFEAEYFEKYLKELDDQLALNEFEELKADLRDGYIYTDSLSVYILLRTDFYDHIKVNYADYMSYEAHEDWWPLREPIGEAVGAVSSNARGFKPAEMSFDTMVGYQFLHGDVMHLLGNMFFLVICGFAVEAAIGPWVFLAFYLVTGIAGALLHSYFDAGSYIPLIGASGAVSGVMAMYLGLFRLRQIEFFYWFFIFVGYFRAPALMIFPFYVGKELYSFHYEEGSNVAFMAHTGGFAVGVLLIGLLLILKLDIFDKQYIEEDQQADPEREGLAKVMADIDKLQFASARARLDALVETYGLNFRMAVLRYKLSKMSGGKQHALDALSVLKQDDLSLPQIREQEKVWKESSKFYKYMKPQNVLELALRLVELDNPAEAEEIFHRLEQSDQKFNSKRLGFLARRLAERYQELNDDGRSQKYSQKAASLMVAS